MKKRENISSVLKEVLLQVKPEQEEMKEIKAKLKDFLARAEQRRKKERLNAQIFVGGSFAKDTMIKKDSYDIDIFVRFDRKYKDSLLSDLAEKMLKGEKTEKIHGSRDYFRIKQGKDAVFEVVPVKKISNPKEAENVTDFSYSHVNYIKKKIKSQKTLDEIRIAKAFCYANSAYGAESYVHGFSGYGIELLIYHYGSFMKFVKAIVKMDAKKKEIIDIEKHHKNKSRILMDLNSAKLNSPIILIDPTYKQRNVLAALSGETFRNFQKACRDFLRNPSLDFFRQKIVDIEKVRETAIARDYEFVLIKLATDRQEGDIAGSKLLKFYNHLAEETGKLYDIKARGFEYGKEKSARAFFVVKRKEGINIAGPDVNDEKNAKKFKLKHKIVSIKNGRLYAKIKVASLKDFLKEWAQKNLKKMEDMDMTKVEIIR